MSIRSGDLIHVGDQLLIDRAQTAGVSNLNQPQDRVYELGNFQTVGIVRDIPDLSFGVESVDASAALEALLCGSSALGVKADATATPPITAVTADPDGTLYDIGAAQVLDVVGQFKRGRQFPDPEKNDTMASIATPQLTLESLSYRFGMRANAAQTATFKGDSLFMAEGSGYIEECTGTEAKAGYVLLHDAIPYNGDVLNGKRFVLNARIKNGRRLRFGVDYTEDAVAGTGPEVGLSAVTITVHATDVVNGDVLSITYQSDTIQNYPQTVHVPDGLVKPAAVRGKDITVFMCPRDEDMFMAPPASPEIDRAVPTDATFYMTGVQDVSADWRATLQNDEEFGNSQLIGTDFDIPTVGGTVTLKPVTPHDYMEKVRKIAGLASGAIEVIGPYQVVSVQLAYVLHSPVDGHVLKTIYCPDARFTLPAGQMRVQQKLSQAFTWEGVTGAFYVAKGVLDASQLPPGVLGP